MRIICTTPDFHHPLVPSSHRHYHFIKELSKRHELTWFTLAQKQVPEIALEEMREYTESMHVYRTSSEAAPASNSRLQKFLWRRKTIHRMAADFNSLIQRAPFDVVLFHGKILFPLISKCELPVVVDFCDATSMRFTHQMRHEPLRRMPLIAMQYLLAKRLENSLLRKSKEIAFISARDRSAVVGNDITFEVVPNGVDPDFWSPARTKVEPYTIALTGGMNYPPNESAALTLIRKIMPLLRKRFDRPKLLLIGRTPTEALKREAALHDDVTLTGTVDDVRPWMNRASVFAAPIPFASGMQNKALEAMAMKLPVVTTSVVAQGVRLNGVGDPPVVVADDDQAFASEIIRLLEDERKRNELGEFGRKYVEENFSWISSAMKFEHMCAVASGYAR